MPICDPPEGRAQLRPIEVAVVVDPDAHHSGYELGRTRCVCGQSASTPRGVIMPPTKKVQPMVGIKVVSSSATISRLSLCCRLHPTRANRVSSPTTVGLASALGAVCGAPAKKPNAGATAASSAR